MGKRPPASQPHSEKAIEAQRKAGLAVEARLAGASYSAIAEHLGYHSTSAAYKAVERGMRALGKPESAEKLRNMEQRRLDRMQRALWSAAIGAKDVPANMEAIDRILKIMARRAKLDGLDAPMKVARTDTAGNDLTPEKARQRLLSIVDRLRVVSPNGNGTVLP